MALGHLEDFRKFDFALFFRDKACEVTSILAWDEYKKEVGGRSEKTGNILGCRVKCTIIQDSTNYDLKVGEEFSNKYKDIVFKIPVSADKLNLKMGDKVCGSSYSDQGGYFKPVVVKCIPYASSGFKINELSIEVSGFERVPKVAK